MRVIDSNGQKYRAGWDEHGWFKIEIGEMWQGEFHAYEDQHAVTLPPGTADELTELILDGP